MHTAKVWSQSLKICKVCISETKAGRLLTLHLFWGDIWAGGSVLCPPLVAGLKAVETKCCRICKFSVKTVFQCQDLLSLCRNSRSYLFILCVLWPTQLKVSVSNANPHHFVQWRSCSSTFKTRSEEKIRGPYCSAKTVYEFWCSLFALVRKHIPVTALKLQPRLCSQRFMTLLCFCSVTEAVCSLRVSCCWSCDICFSFTICPSSLKVSWQLFGDRPRTSSLDALHHIMVRWLEEAYHTLVDYEAMITVCYNLSSLPGLLPPASCSSCS